MRALLFTPPLPEFEEDTYPQYCVLLINCIPVGAYRAATVPNPLVPGQPDRPNLYEYPVVKSGVYDAVFNRAGHKGKPAVRIHADQAVPIVQATNPRTGALGTATGIRIHEGYKGKWRGSAGCITLAPGGGDWLLSFFREDEKMLVAIPSPDWFIYS